MARKLATHRDEVEQDPDEIRKMKRKVFQGESQDVALTKTQLKKRPGWNDARIEKFLGEPDFHTDNSYRKYVQTSWYMMSRIKKAERYKTFQKEAARAIAQHETRRKVAQKAADKRREKTLAEVRESLQDVKIRKRFRRLKEYQLQRLAVDHYNDFQEYRAMERGRWDYSPATIEGSSEAFMERIVVNFLRHEATNYDESLFAQYKKTGKLEAISLIRSHIYQIIATEYPFLAEECARQAADRGVPMNGLSTDG